MVWKGHGRRSSACPKAPTGITSLCSAISTDPLLHTQLTGWRQRTKNCQRVQGRECWSHVGCCPAWEPGLTEWRGWVLTQALLPPMKQVLETLTDAFTLLLWGELGWLGVLAPCLCWAARLQCSSALTWGSGGDFLHTNPSQTRKSLVLVLCLCYYKLPVWQLEQKILLVLLKQ